MLAGHRKTKILSWFIGLAAASLLLSACGSISTENDRSSLQVLAANWPERTSLREGSTVTFSYTLHNQAGYPIKLKNAEPLSFQGISLLARPVIGETNPVLQPGEDYTLRFNFTVSDVTLLRYPFALGVYYAYGGSANDEHLDNYELALKFENYDLAKS